MISNGSPLSQVLSNEKDKILACVHCGLCLESCPTYTVTGNENDSPRGRIYLMRAVEEGKLAPDSSAFESHINRCLGCRACEQVCPAGVEYGNLLEVSRAELRSAGAQHGFAQRAISFALRSLWPYPKRLAAFFWFARLFRSLRVPSILLATKIPLWFFPRVAFALALLRSSTPADLKMTKTGERPAEIPSLPGDRRA